MNVPIPQLRVREYDLLQGTVRREWGALRHCADCLLLQGSYRCCSYKKDWKNSLFRQLTYKFSNFFPNPRHRFERKRELYFWGGWRDSPYRGYRGYSGYRGYQLNPGADTMRG